jgi:protein AroM
MALQRHKAVVLTIGQAPRTDVEPLISKWLDPCMDVVQKGVLDGLTPEEIRAKFEPVPGEFMLATRLVDGHCVTLSAARTELALQAIIEDSEQEGYEFIILLCTGAFPRLKTRTALLFEPERILTPSIARMAGSSQVGLVIPLPAQSDEMLHKWGSHGAKVTTEAASPYTGTPVEIGEAARRLAEAGAEMIVLDCMGYTREHRIAARQASGKPVILSSELLFKMLSELGES